MEKIIRVLLADDHPLVRAGIRATLIAEGDFALIGEATNGDEVRQMCSELKPDVLLLDVQMPGPTAVQTVSYLRTQCPELRVMVLTAHDNEVYVRSLISAGAVGYVLKDEAPQVVVRAIRTVLLGDTWFSRPIVEKMARLGIDQPPSSESTGLTKREIELLQLLVNGNTDRQIGQALGIAERTVRHYLRNIYSKLGVNSRVEAAVCAVNMGLVQK